MDGIGVGKASRVRWPGKRIELPYISGQIYGLSSIGKPGPQNLNRLNDTLIYGRFE